MSEKGDSTRSSASLPIKKRKLNDDSSSSSGSASDGVKKLRGEAAIEDPPPTQTETKIADILDTLNKPYRNQQDDKAGDEYDSQSRQKSASCSNIDQPAASSDIYDKFMVYQKSLTRDDVLHRRLEIPLEDAIEFMPEPSKHEGRYELKELKLMDHKKRTWKMKASFDELSSSYLLRENWDKYLDKYELEPDDVIFLYEDATDDKRLLIEFRRRKIRNIPKEGSTGEAIINNDDKFLVFEKTLTRDDVMYRRLVIPLEDAIEFMPEPSKDRGRHELKELKLMDHKKQMWNMKASFDEMSSSYLLWENWDKYLNEYGLEPDDVILLYDDPDVAHLLIDFQKRKQPPVDINNPANI